MDGKELKLLIVFVLVLIGIAICVSCVSSFEIELRSLRNDCDETHRLVFNDSGEEIEKGISVFSFTDTRTEYRIRVNDDEYIVMQIHNREGVTGSINLQWFDLNEGARHDINYTCSYEMDLDEFEEYMLDNPTRAYRKIYNILIK